jgi:hypothetical protein
MGGENGVSGGDFDIYGANRTIPRAMTAFTAIAWYNSIEVLVLLFFVFKRYSGLYWWSLLINAISIVPYATGELVFDTSTLPAYVRKVLG